MTLRSLDPVAVRVTAPALPTLTIRLQTSAASLVPASARVTAEKLMSVPAACALMLRVTAPALTTCCCRPSGLPEAGRPASTKPLPGLLILRLVAVSSSTV